MVHLFPAHRMWRRFHAGLRVVTVGILLILTVGETQARTPQLPEWFQFSAALTAPPEMGKAIQVIATLTALVGDLQDVRVTLLPPAGWNNGSASAQLTFLPRGTTRTFSFSLSTDKPLPNGSIQCSFSSRVPKQALIQAIDTPFPDEREAMAKAIQAFPDRGQGFADIAFAVFPEEGFFPLGSDMWLTYDDRLKPAELLKGPVLYQNSIISAFQAQTDVEMYEKLQQTMKADPTFAGQLADAGIDLQRKQSDYLAGLYALAGEEYLKGNFSAALSLLDRLSSDNPAVQQHLWEDQTVAEGNLRGLCLWSQGDKKRAEQTLKQAFYKNRKNPVQRYVLRNLGLLYLDMGNPGTAKEMFRLALNFKPEYTLLSQEFSRISDKGSSQ